MKCRKDYTRKRSIEQKLNAKRRLQEEEADSSKISPPRTRTRVSETTFCFHQCCLFCGSELNEELEKKKALQYRCKIFKVTTLSFKDSILTIAKTLDDVAKATSSNVAARIEFEYDLVAAEAKYHTIIAIATILF